MKDISRVFLVVLDSVGVGALPDSAKYGDEEVNTLKSLYQTGILNIPNLLKLGIGNIEGLSYLGTNDNPIAVTARMAEASCGKDTTIGHWEIAGHISQSPLPTFPNGFPKKVTERLEEAFGRKIICNKPYSGTQVLEDYGEEHIKTGKLIVYTSADSVLQIAAHTEVVALEALYGYCRIAREIMRGEELGVGRVIARPFDGNLGEFKRTADRRDFSAEPPRGLLGEALLSNGLESIAVGKISDIFAGKGFSKSFSTHSNAEGMEICDKMVNHDFKGLCFVNLVDFDMLWGHRRDAINYAKGLNSFDLWLGSFLEKLRPDDMLIITADHGCDPCYTATTDHTREYTPCLIYNSFISGKNIGTRNTFADIGATVADALGVAFVCDGNSMIDDIEVTI